MSQSINWSYVAHVVGGMLDDEEYQPVRVRLVDGTTIEIARLEKDGSGQWVLVATSQHDRGSP